MTDDRHVDSTKNPLDCGIPPMIQKFEGKNKEYVSSHPSWFVPVLVTREGATT